MAVVDHHVRADELRQDRGAPRPVLMTLRLPSRMAPSTLLGEVRVDKRAFPLRSEACLLLPAADDEDLRPLVVARAVALGEHAPRGAGVTTTGGAALAAAHGVVDRVHHHAAVVRAAAEPARAPGLAEADAAVVAVAERADGGAAVDVDPATSPDGRRTCVQSPSRAIRRRRRRRCARAGRRGRS